MMRQEQCLARRGRQGPQRQAGAPSHPTARPLEQVGPRDHDDEHWRIPQAGHEVGQQVEKRRLGPVGVVDDDHERLDPGERADELQEGPGGVLARLAVLEPDPGGDTADRDRRYPERVRELVGRSIALRLQHGFAQRPQRDALAVGGTAARQHCAVFANERVQLGDEAGLADAGLADDGQQFRRALRHDARERVAEEPDLLLPPDERLVEPAVDCGRVLVDALQPEASVREPGGVRGVTNHLPGRLGEADLPARARARQLLGHGHRLADHASSVDRAARGHDLTGTDAGACAQTEGQLLDPGAEVRRGSECALRIVLVGHWDAEHGQYAVVAPLDDGAFAARAHLERRVVEAADHGAQRFRVGACGAPRRRSAGNRRRSPTGGCRSPPARVRVGGTAPGRRGAGSPTPARAAPATARSRARRRARGGHPGTPRAHPPGGPCGRARA